MISSINAWLIRLFCIFWAVILFLDYANHSGYLAQAFTYFEYTGLLVTSVIVSVMITWLFVSKKDKSLVVSIKNFRPVYSYLFVLMFMMLIMSFYINQTELTSAKGSAHLMFLVNTLGFHFAVFLILAASFSTGSFMMRVLGAGTSGSSLFFISLSLGFLIMTMALFLLGLTSVLTQPAVIILILLMIVPGWKNILSFLKDKLFVKQSPFQLHLISILPFGLILFMMALNFCYTTRPFPVGFDDLNLYMNVPKLIAGYGGLTEGGDAYNWSLVMSLGFIMYESAAIAILISVIPGILATMVLYRISRKLSVKIEWSLLAAALFYTLPNIIWQSRNDAKVDLALTFVILTAILLLIEFYLSKEKFINSLKINGVAVQPEIITWSLVGLLVGFAFGIKYTSMLCAFGFLVYLFYTTAGKWAAIGMFFFNFVIIFGLKLTRFAAFEAESNWLAITPLVLSITFFGLAILENRSALIKPVKISIIFGLFIGITFIPWAAKNISENKSVSFQTVLTGKSPLPELYPVMKNKSGTSVIFNSDNINIPDEKKRHLLAGMNISGFIQRSADFLAKASENNPSNGTDMKATANEIKYTDKYEEIRRYLGYEPGVIRFISLPYDLAMKTNVRLWSADTGILMIIILPLLMLVYQSRGFVINIIKMLLLIFTLIVCMLSVEMFIGPFNINTVLDKLNNQSFAESPAFQFLSPLYYYLKKTLLLTGKALMPVYVLLTKQNLGLSFMLIMLSSILIYFLYKKQLHFLDKPSKSIVLFTFCVLMCWMILSSGIFWYGMVGFALLMVVMMVFVQRCDSGTETRNKFITYFVAACAVTWFVLILPFQFMPLRFTMVKDMTTIDFNGFIDRPFANYAIGASKDKQVFKQFFQPAEQGIINVLNTDKKAGVLNVSTFLTYHITNNDRRVHADNQLGVFDRVYTLSGGDKEKIIAELKRIGIKYVLVSLHTPTLDMTPEKSLTRKYNNMMQSLVNNRGARLLFTNRIVERPDGNMDMMIEGKSVKAMYHVAGMRMLSQGTVVMFEII